MKYPYSPFQSPPDFDSSKLHANAVMVQNRYTPIIKRCQCCSKLIHEQSLPICTSNKDLNFLGAEITLLFYYIEISLLLMLISLFVGAGQFITCSIKETCYVDLNVEFSFLDYIVELPVGYTDRGDLQVMHLIILSLYTVMFAILQIILRIKMFHSERITNANLCVMLVNVHKKSTKQEITELIQGYNYQVTGIYLIKKLRPWLKVIKYKCKLKKQYLRALKQRKTAIQTAVQTNYIKSLQEIDEHLNIYYKTQKDDLKYRTSYVIVRMQSEDHRNQFIKKSQVNIIMKLWYKLCTCFSPFQIHNQHISVIPAPPPKDIIWQNLEMPYIRTLLKRALSNFVSLLLVIFSSMGTLYLTTHQDTFLQGVLVSASIQISNIIIVQFIEWSSSGEDYITHTDAKISLTLKLTFFQFLNVTLMPFLIFAYRVFIWDAQSDHEEVALTEMTTSIVFIFGGNLIKPFLMVFSIERFIMYVKKRRAMKQGINSQLSQYEANMLFEPPEFHIEVIYSVIVSSMMGTFFYLSIVPSIIIVELLLIFMIMIAARHLLFKVCKTPKQFTSLLNRSVNKISQLCIIIYWVGRVVFKIILADSKHVSDGMAAMLENMYFKIEIVVVGCYIIFVYMLSIDEWIGKKIGQRQRRNRQSLKEELGGSVIDHIYEDAHSFIGLVENNDIQDMTYDQVNPVMPEQSYPDYE